MGIGRKMLILHTILAMISVLLVFIVGHQLWNTSYLSLEERDVYDNTQRAYQAWMEEADGLATIVSDWAPWDEAYDFMQQPWNDEFEKKNLSDIAMANLRIHQIILANPKGEIVYMKTRNSNRMQQEGISAELVNHVKKINGILPVAMTPEDHIQGFLIIDNQLILVTAQRITKRDFGGPSPGILILLRNIELSYVKKISKRVQVTMKLDAIEEGNTFATQEYWQTIINEKQVRGYQVINDIYGEKICVLETIMPRDIYQQGQQQMKSYAILTLLFGLGIAFITLLLFEKLIVKPLRKLDGFMKNVGDGGTNIERLSLADHGEFSHTARTINQMLDQVQEAQNKLKELSLYDSLTGLYNRNFFKQESVALLDKNTQSIGVISCDLDGLKFANDTLGHSVGDEMLVQTSQIITQVLEKRGKAIRMGGDEFVLLLLNVEEEDVRQACESIEERLQRINRLRKGFRLQLSIGWQYSDTLPITAETMLTMIEKADDAMYRQKLANSFEKRRFMMQEIMEMLNYRDYLNEGHGERVGDMAKQLGEAIGLEVSQLQYLKMLGNFHDVGKVGIKDEIIKKQELLSPEEIIEVRRHAEIGYRIAQTIPELMVISDFILKHHEWWNGEGYPIGLKGKEIPIEDRILSIIDTYDEMTSERPYRQAMTPQEAIDEIETLSGIQFDPELVPIFKKIIKDS